MPNPIVQKMMGGNVNQILSVWQGVQQMMNGGNAQLMANNLMNQNAQFRQFAQEYQNSGFEGVCKAYGLNPNEIKKVMGR